MASTFSLSPSLSLSLSLYLSLYFEPSLLFCQRKTPGQWVFDSVLRKLDLLERDYFGLLYDEEQSKTQVLQLRTTQLLSLSLSLSLSLPLSISSCFHVNIGEECVWGLFLCFGLHVRRSPCVLAWEMPIFGSALSELTLQMVVEKNAEHVGRRLLSQE